MSNFEKWLQERIISVVLLLFVVVFSIGFLFPDLPDIFVESILPYIIMGLIIFIVVFLLFSIVKGLLFGDKEAFNIGEDENEKG